MQLDVRLSVLLRKGRFTRKRVALADGSTVADLLQHLDLPASQVAVVVVNGRHATPDATLESGDTVAMFPHVGGG